MLLSESSVDVNPTAHLKFDTFDMKVWSYHEMTLRV